MKMENGNHEPSNPSGEPYKRNRHADKVLMPFGRDIVWLPFSTFEKERAKYDIQSTNFEWCNYPNPISGNKTYLATPWEHGGSAQITGQDKPPFQIPSDARDIKWELCYSIAGWSNLLPENDHTRIGLILQTIVPSVGKVDKTWEIDFGKVTDHPHNWVHHCLDIDQTMIDTFTKRMDQGAYYRYKIEAKLTQEKGQARFYLDDLVLSCSFRENSLNEMIFVPFVLNSSNFLRLVQG